MQTCRGGRAGLKEEEWIARTHSTPDVVGEVVVGKRGTDRKQDPKHTFCPLNQSFRETVWGSSPQ